MTTTPSAPIDTARVANRRSLRFSSLDEILADLDRLDEAHRAGRLRHLGNWTPGQNFGHLASWIGYGFDGNSLNPPWFIKLILKMQKKKYLTGGMPVGVKIPKVPGGTLGTEACSFDEGMSRYRAAIDRLRRSPPQRPNQIFGPLTHDEWIQLACRHAELHLGFLRPE